MGFTQERLRPDWPQLVYKYYMKPIGDVPEYIMANARRQSEVWNKAVSIHNQTRANIEELNTQKFLQVIQTEASASLREEVAEILASKNGYNGSDLELIRRTLAERKKESIDPLLHATYKEAVEVTKAVRTSMKKDEVVVVKWKEFHESLKTFSKSDEIKDLSYSIREGLFSRFDTARQRAYADAGTVRYKAIGASVNLRHRYGGGGLKTTDFLDRRSPITVRVFAPKEAVVRRNMDARLWRCTFYIAKQPFLFEVLAHKPLPLGTCDEDCPRVKIVEICGKKTIAGWEWSLNITVEIPPPALLRQERIITKRDFGWKRPEIISQVSRKGGDVVALDMGWRRLDDVLRIAYLMDDKGNNGEIAIPLVSGRLRYLRKVGRVKDFDTTVVERITELKSRVGNLVEAVKSDIKHLIQKKELHPDLQKILMGFVKLRQGGLVRIMRLLQLHHPEKAEEIAILQRWLESNDYSAIEAYNLGCRFAERRRRYYEAVAHDLCRVYKVIIIEKLDLKRLAERGNKKRKALAQEGKQLDPRTADEIIFEESQKYRVLANLHFFRETIERIAAKYGVEVKKIEGAYSTTTCHICGSQCESTPQLFITCPNGHRTDQDEQGARNLLMTGT